MQADGGAHTLLIRERGHRPRVVKVAAQWPLAVHRFAGGQRRGDELSVVGDLDGYRDHVDIWLCDQLLVVREHRADPEHIARGTR